MTHPIIQAEVDEFQNDILKNYSSLNHQVCSRAMTIEDILEDIMPKFSAALHRAIEKSGKEIVGEEIKCEYDGPCYGEDGCSAKNGFRSLAISKLDTIINFKE